MFLTFLNIAANIKNAPKVVHSQNKAKSGCKYLNYLYQTEKRKQSIYLNINEKYVMNFMIEWDKFCRHHNSFKEKYYPWRIYLALKTQVMILNQAKFLTRQDVEQKQTSVKISK